MDRVSVIGSPSGPYYEFSSQKGDDTPKELRKKGLWPINKYEVTRELTVQNDSLLVDARGKPFGTTRYRTVDFIQVSSSPPEYPSYNDILIKLREKWSDTDLNLGMYASPEGRESLEMMGTSLLKLANSARSLKRGDFDGFARNLRTLPRHSRQRSFRKFEQGDISGSFLAAHLGWEPLIKDLYEASGLVDLQEDPYRITARKLGGMTITPLNIGNYPGATFTEDHKVQIRLTLDMKRPPSFQQRFGLDNPFLIAWELVPLSFVADYFLPIGDVIAGCGAVSAMYGSHGFSKTYMHNRHKVFIPRGTKVLSIWGTPYFLQNDLYREYKRMQFKRDKYTPSFTDVLKNLRITMPNGVWKLSTLAALTHQRILSLSR